MGVYRRPYVRVLDNKNESNIQTKKIHQMSNNTFTREEAIALMKTGEKLTHEYFTRDEWATMQGNFTIVTEDGCRHPSDEFWKYRQGESFDTGWTIWEA